MTDRPTISMPEVPVRLRSLVIKGDQPGEYWAFWSDRQGIHLVIHIDTGVTAVEHWALPTGCWRELDLAFSGRRRTMLYNWLFNPRQAHGS